MAQSIATDKKGPSKGSIIRKAMGGGASQYEWKKLCRPLQAVKNISFHPYFKPSVTESKVAHQLLLNGKLVTNM